MTIIGRVTEHVNEAGETVRGTNMFTLMENCINYFENGEWKSSEDVIEVFPEGAIARKGPHKAIFSPSLANAVVFDVQTSGGRRIKGGPRRLQVFDYASNQSAVLSEIDKDVQGELVPPNMVLFRNAFKGDVRADLVYVWKHNYFAQDIILTSRPRLPEGFRPASSRFEVVTEFIDAGQVSTKKQTFAVTDRVAIEEDTFIGFGELMLIPGKLFAVEGELNMGGMLADGSAPSVKKQWIAQGPGRDFLIESVSWQELAPLASRLQAAAGQPLRKENGRSWPEVQVARAESKPIALALAAYTPKGVVLDFVTSPSPTNLTIFTNGVTYYIQNNFIATNITFEPGTVIKYKTNAYLLLTGTATFPSTLQTPVFTSRNDDAFGDKIEGVSGEDPSDGDPTKHPAAQALWFYYGPSNMVQCAAFRWCKIGVYFDNSSGTNSVKKSLFENITGFGTSAIQVGYTPKIVLEESEKCNVTTSVANHTEEVTTVTGSLASAAFCASTSFFAGGYNFRNSSIISASNVPDTMGAVGPDHFVELINSRGVAFDKETGAVVDNNSSTTMFGGSQILVDPRIYFDANWGSSGRWIATMWNSTESKLWIAIKDGANPTDLDSWTKFSVSVTYTDENQNSYFPDFPVLGVDPRGIYVVMRLTRGTDPFNPDNLRFALLGIKKPSGGGIVSTNDFSPLLFLNEDAGYKKRWAMFATQFDSGGTNSWLLSKGSPGTSGGSIDYRKVWWNETNLVTDQAWNATSGSFSNAYYDLDNNFSFAVPQKTSPTTNPSKLKGSTIQSAIVRNGYLWACQHIGLDGPDAVWDGNSADRMAVQWMRLKITSSTTLSMESTDGGLQDRIYDQINSSSPYFFFVPSLSVNSNGDMIVGFSCARGTEYIGALGFGRKSNGSGSTRPFLIQGGRGVFSSFNRWGDYTQVSPDPESSALWTIQQYAEQSTSSSLYGLWVVKVSPQ